MLMGIFPVVPVPPPGGKTRPPDQTIIPYALSGKTKRVLGVCAVEEYGNDFVVSVVSEVR
jgi:hypothetical protein